MATRTSRRKTIFFAPRSRRLADVVSIESPAAFRRSVKTLSADGLDVRQKRALVLAQNRARAMLKKRSLSDDERRQFQEIASIELPPVTKRASGASSRRGGRARDRGRTTGRPRRGR